MSRPFARSWLLAAILAALGGAGNAIAQTASCNITYTWPTWVGGNGFGASIDIRNTGPAITNGWTLVFNFPNGQQLQNGWPVAFSQSGATLTVASNADWNKAIATNGVFNVGFNGKVMTATYSGVVPDTFKNDSEVVLKGKLSGDGFAVDPNGVMAKCPSKYNPQGPAKAGS